MFYEIKVMRVIMETMKNLIAPLKNLLMVMFLQSYIFALVGMFMFGGEVLTNSPAIYNDSSIPDNYPLINYNDLVSSFVTLFILIVVNNWFVIVQMYVDVNDGRSLYRLYFIVWYYFGVIIGLNIIVAFAIDMYSAFERLDRQKVANEKYLTDLADQKIKLVPKEQRKSKRYDDPLEAAFESSSQNSIISPTLEKKNS